MSDKQQNELCSECEANAQWYCVQDEANFCDQHNTLAHSFKSQKLHRIIPIDEKAAIIRNQAAKPKNCKNHHMPLCLYCLSCKNVCCIACLSVDIHKHHSDQVKSIVDVANEEKKILNEHLQAIQKLKTIFSDEQKQLEKMLLNLEVSEAESSQEIDKEFDRTIDCVQARRHVLKEQLKKKREVCRDNIHLRQEDVKNINSSLNRRLEEGHDVLTLDDFAALSQSNTIVEKMKELEIEINEHHHQTQLIDSVPFRISNQKLLDIVNTLGAVGAPPTPLFVEQKCKASDTYLDIEWEPTICNPPVTAYILELIQGSNESKEIYRGLETKYHLQSLKPNTSYVLHLSACHENEVGNATALEMKTLEFDLNNWTLTMSSTYAPLNAENTRDSLLDGQFTTGAAAHQSGNEWIQATFPHPVPVSSVTIAPLHKNPNAWAPGNGNGGTLEYSHDNRNWTTVGTIAYVKNQQQKIEINNVNAQYWRLFYCSSLGTSSFIFK